MKFSQFKQMKLPDKVSNSYLAKAYYVGRTLLLPNLTDSQMRMRISSDMPPGTDCP